MDSQPSWRQRDHLISSISKSGSMLIEMLPLILGVILLTGLFLKLLPVEAAAGWFGANGLLDAVIGALAGSISAGHPATSYVLGGELLARGVSLIAVTAFLISWVTVGSIQLPAEALMLGWRFALLRNLVCFLFAVLIAPLTVLTLGLID